MSLRESDRNPRARLSPTPVRGDTDAGEDLIRAKLVALAGYAAGSGVSSLGSSEWPPRGLEEEGCPMSEPTPGRFFTSLVPHPVADHETGYPLSRKSSIASTIRASRGRNLPKLIRSARAATTR